MDEIYKISYENDFSYCYPNSTVLKNKLGITDSDDLYQAERELVSYRIISCAETPIKGNFNFEHLQSIHQYLFQDIYEWAGQTRNCAIAKKGLFCLPQNIYSYSNIVFNELEKNNYYIDFSYEKTMYSLIRLFADINALHPFREGNGRTQREFIHQLAAINGIDIDFANIDDMEMIEASHDSLNGKYQKLTEMFIKHSYQIEDSNIQINAIKNYIKSAELQTKLIQSIIDSKYEKDNIK